MTRNSFKISFFLRKNVVAKDGTCAILMRITINKEATQFATKANCSIEEWDTVRGCAKGTSKKAKAINAMLDECKAAVIHHIQDIERRESTVTLEKVKNAFFGVTAKNDTLLTFFNQYLENAKKMVGISKSKATVQKYQRCYNRLAEFMKSEYHISDIALLDTKYGFIVDFDAYLRRVCNCSPNTAAKFIQTLRMIIIYAKNNGVIFADPFVNYKIKLKPVDRGYLTIEELNKIAQKEISIKRMAQVRDVFLFSCFTGLAYIDMYELREEDIKDAPDGRKWIMTRRHKTGTPVNVPLLDFPLSLIEKYKGKLKDGKVLPVLSNQRLNSYLKELADICGIDKRVTFHLARHTFATTITLANGVPIETVSKLLGHTQLKTTQIYARITNEKIKKDMEILAAKLPEIEINTNSPDKKKSDTPEKKA